MDIKTICPHCNKPISVCAPKHKDCIYLTGDKSKVGVRCMNPRKTWSRSLSMYKQPCGPACSMFIPKETINTEVVRKTVNEFWSDLVYLGLLKDKEVPTLEELLEYIDLEKQDAVSTFKESLFNAAKKEGTFDLRLILYSLGIKE